MSSSTQGYLKLVASFSLLGLLAVPSISQACVTRHQTIDTVNIYTHDDQTFWSDAITVTGQAKRCGVFKKPRARLAAAQNAVDRLVEAWWNETRAGNLHRHLVRDCREQGNRIRVKEFWALTWSKGPDFIVPASLSPQPKSASKKVVGDARCTSYTPPRPVTPPPPPIKPAPPCKDSKCLPY